MSGNADGCVYSEHAYGFVIGALSAAEEAEFTPHLAQCESCRGEVEALRRVMASFIHWPSDILRPSASLWDRLSERIQKIGDTTERALPCAGASKRFEWKEVAPGISCKLLATDLAHDRVSMLVRLAPGTDYPPHRHAGFEELHLLHGELVINDSKFYPGDYYRADAGTSDTRVRSDTGCTCVLVTSPSDELR